MTLSPGETQRPPPSAYDLFVSYAPADREWVEGYLLDALQSAQIKVISAADFELGAPRITEFERAVQQSKRTLLVLTPAAINESFAEFVTILVQAYGLESGTWPVIPLIHKPVKLPPRLALLVPLDATEPALWPEAVERLCASVQKAPPAQALRLACPYPGMRAFREQEASHFYGREAETDELLQRLRRHPFAAVIGASGSGKSSLVYAGLIPALRRSSLFGPGGWLIRSIRPGAHPLETLQTALGTADIGLFDPAALLAAEPGAARFLLVIDQFEEVFTQGAAERDAFLAAIQRLVALRDCHVVLTMRSDFFDDLLKSTLWPLAQPHRLEIAPLGERELREAIVKPAEDTGVFIESALAERLVSSSAGQPGLLPFVQEVMVRLWEKLERRFLPLRAYEALVLPLAGYSGSERTGIQAAMAQLGDEMIRSLSPEQQRISQRILLRLVQFGEGRNHTRRQQPLSALVAEGDDPALFDRTLNYLVENRLLVLSSEAGTEPRVDLAHEAMLTGWPRLGQWITEFQAAEVVRRRLEDKAAEWVRLGRGEGGLLDRVELREAEAWLKATDLPTAGCSANLAALIGQSRAAVQRQQRRRITTRTLTFGILGLIALLLAGIGIDALSRWSLNRRWQPVAGAPGAQRISALASTQETVVIGSYYYGAAWTRADGTWTGWQREGLPLGNPTKGLNDPQATVQSITALALDSRRPDERYAFIQGYGVYKYNAAGASWSEISQNLPRNSDACQGSNACQPLAASAGVVAYIADRAGFWLSENGGGAWTAVRPEIAAGTGQLWTAAFDAQGQLVLGDEGGLIRGSGDPPYTWERVYSGGLVLLATPAVRGGLLLIVKVNGALQALCLDAHSAPIGAPQTVPGSRGLLGLGRLLYVPDAVSSAAADARTDNRYFLATADGAVYATDCVHPPVRIGQHGWFEDGLLATTAGADQQGILYWGSAGQFKRYLIP